MEKSFVNVFQEGASPVLAGWELLYTRVMFLQVFWISLMVLFSWTGEARLCRAVFPEKVKQGEALKNMSAIRAEISITSSFPIANQAHARALAWHMFFHGIEASMYSLLDVKSVRRATGAANGLHRQFGIDRQVDFKESGAMILGHYMRALTVISHTLMGMDPAYFGGKTEIQFILDFFRNQQRHLQRLEKMDEARRSQERYRDADFDIRVLSQRMDQLIREYPHPEKIQELRALAERFMDTYDHPLFRDSVDRYVAYIQTYQQNQWNHGPSVKYFVGFNTILDFSLVRAMKAQGQSNREIWEALLFFRLPDNPIHVEKINEYATDFRFEVPSAFFSEL